MFAARQLLLLLVIVAGSAAYAGNALRITAQGSPPPLRTPDESLSATHETTAPSAPRFSAGMRLIMWGLFVLLAPIAAVPLTAFVLDRQSNMATFLLLIFFTGLDVIAAYMANGVHIRGLISGAFYFGVLFALFVYNVWICTFLQRISIR